MKSDDTTSSATESHDIPMETRRPVAATLSVVTRGDFVLLVRRRHQPDAGLWGFPGGKIRLGETMTAAARRELHEETGVDARPHGIRPPVEIVNQDGPDTIHHFILVPVFLRYEAGEARAGDDAAEADWIHRLQLPNLRSFMSLDVERIATAAIEELKRLEPRS